MLNNSKVRKLLRSKFRIIAWIPEDKVIPEILKEEKIEN